MEHGAARMVRKLDIPKRSMWEDRFCSPTAATLLDQLSKSHEGFVNRARERLLGIGLEETIAWHGIPWRWTFTLTRPGASVPGALIIPQPSQPAIAIPVDATRRLNPRRTPKWILDTVVFSPLVAGVHWPRWELTGMQQIDALLGALVVDK